MRAEVRRFVRMCLVPAHVDDGALVRPLAENTHRVGDGGAAHHPPEARRRLHRRHPHLRSAQVAANTQLLARGMNPDEGGAHMVVHEPEGGGGVFSTGSITYVSSLPVSDALSTITANVVRRFLQ